MAHSGSTPMYSISQQNGGAAVGASQSSRAAQYRRQGSSYGPGHVHNMAVMVAPTPIRVDYSMTKGGLRSWIVLIVFVLLCSTMLTIFSEDGSKNDDEKWMPSIAEETETDGHNDEIPSIVGANIEVDDSDDEEDDEDEDEDAAQVEAAMLARLKEKAELREKHRRPEKKVRWQVKEKDNDDDEKEEEDDDDVEENKEDVEKAINENDDDDDEKEEKETKTDINKDRSKARQDNSANKLRQNKYDDDKDNNDKDDDEDDNENDENENEQELFITRQKKIAKRQKRQHESHTYLKSWRDSSIQAQKLADDVKNPRKNLLKLKKKSTKRLTEDEHNNEEDENIKDEDDNKEDNNNDESNGLADDNDITRLDTPMLTTEIAALNKRPPAYDRKATTNRDDFKVRSQLDDADFRSEKHDFSTALNIYNRILQQNPESPRALYGKAYAYQLKSEFDDENNSYIDEAIGLYHRVLDNDGTPDELFKMAANNLIDCARWIGNLHKVLTVQRALIDKFPENIALQNNFAITFLQMGRVKDARQVFSTVLDSDPTNSVAQAYYGYIFKVYDNDFEKGVLWMRKGLFSSHGAIPDSKFFFHLGDALTRLGREQEALKVYKEAVSLKLFPSVYQRSMHNLDGLTARPWWTLDQTGCGKQLRYIERHWTVIREEALNAWEHKRSIFHNEESHLLDGVEMVVYLRKEWKFAKIECRTNFQNTCEILRRLIEESSCGKDEIKISVMFAGSRVWPNCAPTNYELEAQLGLVTPSEARIHVAQITRGWKSGQFLVFDKSFEHEIWFDGAAASALRIVLSVDLWHPQVPREIRKHDGEYKSNGR